MDDKLHQDSLAEASTSAGLPPSDLSLSLSLSPAASTLVTYRRWTVPERIKLESLVESYGGEAVDWSAVAVAVVAAFPATELGANRTGAECEKKWRTCE